MEQAKQTWFDGVIVYRWYVYDASGKRYITWAATSAQAKARATARGLIVHRVVPAPSLVDCGAH